MSKLLQMSPKEKAQAAALGVLSCGFFGYFAVKVASPSPAAAGSRPAAAAPAPSTATAAPTAPSAAAKPAARDDAATDATADDQAPPPTPGMRDPFVPAVSGAPQAAPAAKAPAPVARVASLMGSAPMTVPVVPPLPVSVPGAFSASGKGVTAPAGAPGLAPLPAAPPAAPKWTATGTLQSGGEQYAILRDGEARRIVRAGDAVDAEFRLAAVTRTAVILRHGALAFTLPLGGARETPGPGAGNAARPAETPTVPPAPALPAPAAVTKNVSTDTLPQG